MSAPVEVNIPGCGIVRGVQVDTQPAVAKFLNVPYATVPERWRLAIKADPWEGIRDASVQGPVCHQAKDIINLDTLISFTVDEDDEEAYSKFFNEKDCLNLNIFVPKDQLNKSGPLIPVMVWIHGGAFRNGNNAMELYNGSNMVAHSVQTFGHPVIVVTINYRLNYFGFLSSQELVDDARLSSNGHEKSVGNWGLTDQRMALEWVRDHIEAFGGNPKNVTTFGESAGAASIGFHLSIPAHHGLFQRAIMQSGATTTTGTRRLGESQESFDLLCKHLGLDDPNMSGAEKLARLRETPAKDIVAPGDHSKVLLFSPAIDNVLIHDDVRESIHDSSRYDPGVKAVMLGDCGNEGSIFVPEQAEPFLEYLKKIYCPPEEEKEFEAIYGTPETDIDAFRISAAVFSDFAFLYPIHATTVALVGSNKTRSEPLELTRYHFDRIVESKESKDQGRGANHAGELPFVFGSDVFLGLLSDAEKALSLHVMEIWIKFAWGLTSQYVLEHGLNSVLPAGEGEAKKEAILFTEEATIEKTHVERLDARTLAFWRRSEEWLKNLKKVREG